MGNGLIEHPDITWAINTGYPSWNQPQEESNRCESCERPLGDSEQYEDYAHEILCMECLLDLHLKR